MSNRSPIIVVFAFAFAGCDPSQVAEAIADKIDFGQVTHIDKKNRTITVHLTSIPSP